ncbi:MAG: type II toxin-antitoxin system VapC family toxin [Gammaproteobacteria bacterium]
MLVVDASAAVQACLAAEGFALFGAEDPVAPALLWSEASSVIHELWWRREISERLASTAFSALLRAPIARRESRRLRREAWRIADELGWANNRLRRGAARIVTIVGPRDL